MGDNREFYPQILSLLALSPEPHSRLGQGESFHQGGAVGVAVAFWPSGIGLLLGLALFRCIALVMTTVPLLKELKKA